MVLAILAKWPLRGSLAESVLFARLALVYLAGGLPADSRALITVGNEHIFDIDLLMVVAAVAAAAVGAPFEGAVLLTLFSISTTALRRGRTVLYLKFPPVICKLTILWCCAAATPSLLTA